MRVNPTFFHVVVISTLETVTKVENTKERVLLANLITSTDAAELFLLHKFNSLLWLHLDLQYKREKQLAILLLELLQLSCHSNSSSPFYPLKFIPSRKMGSTQNTCGNTFKCIAVLQQNTAAKVFLHFSLIKCCCWYFFTSYKIVFGHTRRISFLWVVFSFGYEENSTRSRRSKMEMTWLFINQDHLHTNAAQLSFLFHSENERFSFFFSCIHVSAPVEL